MNQINIKLESLANETVVTDFLNMQMWSKVAWSNTEKILNPEVSDSRNIPEMAVLMMLTKMVS